MKNRDKALLYTSLSILAWSFIPVVSSLAQQKIDGSNFLFYSNIFSVIAIFIYAKISKYSIKFDRNIIKQTAILGFLGTFLYYVCIYFGYKFANPIEVIIVQYLWPVLIVVLSVFLLREKLTFKKILSIILGFLAIVIVITKGDISIFSFNFPIGLSVVLLGAFSFALFSVLSKKIDIDPISATLMFFVWGSLFSLIWVFCTTGLKPLDIDSLFFIAINGIIINGISYIWWVEAIRLWEASKVAVFVYITPILGTLWLVILSNTDLFLSYGIALIFVIIAGILTIWEKDENSTYIKPNR